MSVLLRSEAAPRRTAPRVFVTVGSDHHRFDRLVEWVDSWAGSRGLGREDVLIQHGPARPPVVAGGVDFVDHDALLELMRATDVVVTQGGPMSILESRQQGRRPIVLARTAALGEVVDDHQHTFCGRLIRDGWIDLVSDEQQLHAALDAALAAPESMLVEADPMHEITVAGSVERFARVADSVLATRRPATNQPAVLMLGGFGRSGSTLLERALGEVAGVTALGEVIHLWERGLRDDEHCGCGASFSSCQFWTAVGERAFGGWQRLDPAVTLADRTDVVSNRNLPGLVTGLLPPSRRLRRDRLVRRSSALYAAAAEVSDTALLVDSSKHPAYAYAVRRARIRLRCALVVRDPRGVAYSWSKTVVRPEIRGRDVHMPRYSALGSAVRWSLYAVLCQALRLLRVPVLTVRYEDLVANPRATVAAVLAFAGYDVTDSALAHLQPDRVELGVHHTVAGNPMRFTTGALALRLDEEWRHAMPARDRRLVSLVTAPLRRRYGYHGS